MRLSGVRPADARDLEYGCVEWFDYERHAKGRGRPGRPRGPAGRDSLPRREDGAHASKRAAPAMLKGS